MRYRQYLVFTFLFFITDSGCGSGIETGFCGNHKIDSDEQCDQAALNHATCTSLSQGFSGGLLKCKTDCTFDTSACFSCGDQTVNPQEACDGAALQGKTCQSFGFDSGTLVCNADCRGFDTSGCGRCGDGKKNGNEICDGDDRADMACADLPDFDDGALGCLPDCSGFDTAGCSRCGDGKIEGREQCDGENLGNTACGIEEFSGGSLVCSDTCQLDFTDCFGVTNAQGMNLSNSVGFIPSTPAVSYNDQSYLVAWGDYSFMDDCFIRGAQVSREGTLLTPTALDVSSNKGSRGEPQVSSVGRQSIIVWYESEQKSVFGAVIDDYGQPKPPGGRRIVGAQENLFALASNGSQHLLVWRDQSRLLGTFLDQNGVAVSPEGKVITAVDDRYFAQFRIVYDGKNYFLVWLDSSQDPHRIWGLWLDAQGDPIGAPATLVQADDAEQLSHLTVAFDGTNVLVVWESRLDGSDRSAIFGSFINAQVKVLRTTLLSSPEMDVYQPEVAFNGKYYFVIWLGRTETYSRQHLYGGRIDKKGKRIDPQFPRLSQLELGLSTPRLSCGETNCLVVWSGHSPNVSGMSDLYSTLLTWGKGR